MSFVPFISSRRNKYRAEGALKYFLVQALGSAFVIMRTFMLVMSTG